MPEVTGSCLCGALKLTISPPPTADTVSPQIKAACYCLDCRKGSGGPQQTNAVFNTEDVTLHDPQSKAKTYIVTRTASGKPKDKVFCGECGCTMFTRPMAHEGRATIVKIGIIDGFVAPVFTFLPSVSSPSGGLIDGPRLWCLAETRISGRPTSRFSLGTGQRTVCPSPMQCSLRACRDHRLGQGCGLCTVYSIRISIYMPQFTSLRHSPFPIPYSPFPVPHSSFLIPHSAFPSPSAVHRLPHSRHPHTTPFSKTMPEVTGSCLCGALRLTISQPPTDAGTDTVNPQHKVTCHCIDCRKGSGGANAIFKTEEVTLHDPQSKAKTYTAGTASGETKDTVFCSECGCTMFIRPMVHEGGVTIVKTGVIDVEGFVTPFLSFPPPFSLWGLMFVVGARTSGRPTSRFSLKTGQRTVCPSPMRRRLMACRSFRLGEGCRLYFVEPIFCLLNKNTNTTTVYPAAHCLYENRRTSEGPNRSVAWSPARSPALRPVCS